MVRMHCINWCTAQCLPKEQGKNQQWLSSHLSQGLSTTFCGRETIHKTECLIMNVDTRFWLPRVRFHLFTESRTLSGEIVLIFVKSFSYLIFSVKK